MQKTPIAFFGDARGPIDITWKMLKIAVEDVMQEKGVMELLLQQRDAKEVVSREIRKTWSPLHRAAQRGHEALTKLLVKTGADINGTDEYHRTPLHLAIENAHVDIAKFLIEEGTNLKMQRSRSGVLLDIAIGNSDEATFNLALEKDVGINESSLLPLQNALENGHEDIFKLLLENCADVNEYIACGN
ncbi:hypothetical protein ANO14919_038930 [Xylariales sp. No.14919]|nr:hypothetical protein ANO14919_038930 [Xylariales sp. No.14919]